MNKAVAAGVTATILSLASMPAAAVDGMAIEAGQGDGADMGRVAIQWDWDKPLYKSSGWQLACYWDLGLGYWRKTGFPGRNEEITEIGLTPVLRLQPNNLEGFYAELGLGVHLMSSTTLGDKSMSTQFQFGNHVGIGYRFGVKRAFDLSYRYQHLSNASIKQPNDGINFHQVRLQYHF